MASSGAAAAIAAVACLACSSPSDRGRARSEGDDYLRYVAFELPGNEDVVLRWQKRQMPLRVHLPRPPRGLFEDDQAIYDSVRDGVLDWADAVEPGLPSFVFVDDPGDADIPVAWASEPDGDWYIAHCVYDIQPFSRRFGVTRILVTARRDDRLADIHEVYSTMLHEVGHALGLGGHSPDPGDIMYPWSSRRTGNGLSARDRETLRLLYGRAIGTRVVGARQFP